MGEDITLDLGSVQFQRHPKQEDFKIGWSYLAFFSQPARRCTRKPVSLALFMLPAQHLRRIRFWLVVFIGGLVLSGVTAFPLQAEVHWLSVHSQFALAGWSSPMLAWLQRVDEALTATSARSPFLAYGTDWLAFGHLVIAVAFIGPYVDPVKNKWVITFGLIACAGVIPLAVIAGAMRGIPWWWRMIDCSFGIFGAIPLLICRKSIMALER